MRLNTLIRRVEGLQGALNGMVRTACVKEESWIVEANKGQLREGLNANGVLMNGGVYSPYHLFRRIQKGLPVRHVYLDYEGDLQDGMTVEFGETGFSVKTTDWKQWMVDYTMETGHWPPGNQPEYGPVFGLTVVNRGLLARRIAPRVSKSVRDKLLK